MLIALFNKSLIGLLINLSAGSLIYLICQLFWQLGMHYEGW